MKANKTSSLLLGTAALLILASPQLFAEGQRPGSKQWDVQVEKVRQGDVNIDSAFIVAIYENLLVELPKTKQFDRVFREGDRNAHGATDLLILNTTIESYTPGSETKRAVTTVAGATKLTVLSKLSRPDGEVVLERSVTGNVRFFGGNLRATHNLANNVAKAIKQAKLPAVAVSRSEKIADPRNDTAQR